LLNRFRKLIGPKRTPVPDDARERAISVAGLLVEAARADDHYTEEERALIDHLLAQEFAVAQGDVAAVRIEAEARQKEAVDLYRFTKRAKSLAHDEKVRLVESLWRIILSDGAKHSWEDALVRRVCGLLHVSDVESGLARRRAQEKLGA